MNERSFLLGKEQEFVSTIAAIYDTIGDVDQWNRALEWMCRLLKARSGDLVHWNSHNPRVNREIHYNPTWDTNGHEIQMESFHKDPRMMLANRYLGKPISCRLYLTDEEYRSSVIYQNHLKRFDIEYSLGVNLPEDDKGWSTGIGLIRGRDSRPFSQEEVDLFGELIPHIRRAVALQDRFLTLDLKSGMAMAALDHLPFGCFLLDERMVLHDTNSMGNGILKARDGFLLVGRKLACHRRADDRQFGEIVSELVAAVNRGQPLHGQVLTIRRPSKKQAYQAILSTLWSNQYRFNLGLLNQPMAVVFVTDPEIPQETTPHLLQRLFGLTPREAELVAELVVGKELKAVAEGMGISQETARTHLKTVFGKTNTTRQVDLVRLVLSSPVFMQKMASRPKIE